MKTVIYYFSATGNSLYVARVLQKNLPETELRSIPEELVQENFELAADRIGFIFPLHYLGLSLQVETFLERLTIAGSPYIFAVATCGVPYWGRPFLDMNEILAKKNLRLDGAWFVRLVSNYLPLRDTAADWRIKIRAWFAERKLQKISKSVAQKEGHETWQVMRETCRKYHEEWKARQARIDENFSCDEAKCISCGMCEKICPKQNISRPNGHPVWQHNCVECLGCLHICPAEAIDYGGVTRGRRRYRHEKISPKDLLHNLGKK